MVEGAIVSPSGRGYTQYFIGRGSSNVWGIRTWVGGHGDGVGKASRSKHFFAWRGADRILARGYDEAG
jgi:hypothetical protein